MGKGKQSKADMAAATEALGEMGTGANPYAPQYPPPDQTAHDKARAALVDAMAGEVKALERGAGMAAVDVYADWTVLSRLAERAADSLDEAAASLVAYLHESGDLTEARVVLLLGGVQQMAKRARKLSRTAQMPRTRPGSAPSVPKGLTSTHTATQPEKRASGPEKGTSGE